MLGADLSLLNQIRCPCANSSISLIIRLGQVGLVGTLLFCAGLSGVVYRHRFESQGSERAQSVCVLSRAPYFHRRQADICIYDRVEVGFEQNLSINKAFCSHLVL